MQNITQSIGFILCLGFIVFLFVRCDKDKESQKLCTQVCEERDAVAIPHIIYGCSCVPAKGSAVKMWGL